MAREGGGGRFAAGQPGGRGSGFWPPSGPGIHVHVSIYRHDLLAVQLHTMQAITNLHGTCSFCKPRDLDPHIGLTPSRFADIGAIKRTVLFLKNTPGA